MSGKYLRATDTPILNKQQRLEARWAEYFSDVLNRTQSKIEAEEQDSDTDLDVSAAPPEKKEIMAAIRSLKYGKPRERTVSTLNSSTQSQSLQHKLFSHSLHRYWGRKAT